MRLSLLGFVMLAAGCATASHDNRESFLAQPINCEVAEEDVAALEAAKPSRRERAEAQKRTLPPSRSDMSFNVTPSGASGLDRERHFLAIVIPGRTEWRGVIRCSDLLQPKDPVQRVGITACPGEIDQAISIKIVGNKHIE